MKALPCLIATVFIWVPATLAIEPADAKTDTVTYATRLVEAGLPDYAKRVIGTDQPDSDETRLIHLLILLRTGQIKEAKASLQTLPDPDGLLAWKMKLAYADACYSWNLAKECRGTYDAFLKKYATGPAAGMNEFYRDSVYCYAQTLLLLGDKPAALHAYVQIQKAQLDKPEHRQILAETAQLTLTIAEECSSNQEREQGLQEVWKTCESLAWEQDLWFGHAIVMMARVKMLQGDLAAAREILEDNFETLEAIDRLLRQGPDSPPSPPAT